MGSNIGSMRQVDLSQLFQGKPVLEPVKGAGVKLPDCLKPQAMMKQARRDPYRDASKSVTEMADAIRNLHHLSKADAAVLVRAMASKMAGTPYNAAVVALFDDVADECDKGDALMVAAFADADERAAAKRRGLT